MPKKAMDEKATIKSEKECEMIEARNEESCSD
jgi:hypothetical protein